MMANRMTRLDDSEPDDETGCSGPATACRLQRTSNSGPDAADAMRRPAIGTTAVSRPR